MLEWVRTHTGATRTTSVERLQSLWDGYGEIVRVGLEGAAMGSVIVKSVRPPSVGRSRGSHMRKLRSYAVERAFYLGPGTRCNAHCRIPRCFAAEAIGDGARFVFEDLDAAGFDGRRDAVSGAALDACLAWLARFHARFLGAPTDGLWTRGTYWHLATRPDELAELAPGLRDAAREIAARLDAARHRALVHGDAKPANFCFGGDGRVAALDFQYVGGGVGVQDVVYLSFAAEGRGHGDAYDDALERYFAHLAAALGEEGVEAAPVVAEWRSLARYARADFLRFYAGWAPSARSVAAFRASVDAIAADL